MKLPVTTEAAVPSPDTLWRLYSDVCFDHAVATGDEVDLSYGRGIGRASAPSTAIFPSGPLQTDVMQTIEEAFQRGASTRPSVVTQDDSFTDQLLSRGYVPRPQRLMRLRSAARAEARSDDTLILPIRAAVNAITHWLTGDEREGASASLFLGHLDDPQYDGFVALTGGRVVGLAGLQTRGQTGLIADVFVTPSSRRRGLALHLIARVAELASRAQLQHVFTAISSHDEAQRQLAERAGFVGLLNFQEWTPPQA